MSPEQDSSPELEALVMQGEENKESLNNVEANTSATAVAVDRSNQKLEDIDSNMEARLVQAENHINKLAPSIESMGKAMKTVDTLLNTMRGPQGEKGEKGDKGDKGDKGESGKNGKDGKAGKDGADGLDGKDGEMGPQGPEGPQGQEGPQGKVGPKGDTGRDVDIDKVTKDIHKKFEPLLEQELNKTYDKITRHVGSKTYSANEIQGLAEFIAENGGGSSTAADVSFTPAGTIAATDVQAALEELDADIQGLSAGAGISRTVVVTSGSITVGSAAATDYVYFISGAHTMSLPAAAANTTRYTFKNNHSAAVTINTVGAETIDGSASIDVAPEDAVDIISNGTNYFVV